MPYALLLSHAMPRKRNLIIDQLEKCQMLRFSISDIQHEIDSVRPPGLR